MIIRNDNGYEINPLFPNSDWYNEGNYIIDETTEQGEIMAKIYSDNYPYVTFEHNGEMITNVIILEEQKEIIEQEIIDNALLDSLIPTDREMLLAEIEIQTIDLLMEVGLI